MKMLVTEGRIGIRKCAFCRHWYDPTNSAITPVKAKMSKAKPAFAENEII